MSTLCLDPQLDLTAATSLKQALLDGGPGLQIDAGAVQRVTSPCLQLLVAAVMGGARIEPASLALRRATETLGLTQALGLTGTQELGS